jgi:hypothetical protein
MLKIWFEKNRKFQNILKDSSIFFKENSLQFLLFEKKIHFWKWYYFCRSCQGLTIFYLLFKKKVQHFQIEFLKFSQVRSSISTVSTNINNSFFFFLFFARPFENYFVWNINRKHCFSFVFYKCFTTWPGKKKKVWEAQRETKNGPKSSH